MADEKRSIIYDVDVNTGKAITGTKELETEVNNLERQLLSAKETGQKFADLLEFGAGLTGGIAAFQGVVTLAGVENDKLNESLTRLMAIQTTLSGLQQMANLFRSENIFLTKSLITWIKAKNAVMQKSIALQTTMTLGLTALVAGIVLAVKEYSSWKRELDETPEYEKSKVGKFIDRMTQAFKDMPNLLKSFTVAWDTWVETGSLQKAEDAVLANMRAIEKLTKAEKFLSKFREKEKYAREKQIEILEMEGATEEELFNERKKLLEDEIELVKKVRDQKKGDNLEERKEVIELRLQKKKLETNYTQFLRDEREKRLEQRKEDFEKLKERARTEYEEMKAILDELNEQETEDEKVRQVGKLNEVEQAKWDAYTAWNQKQVEEREKQQAEEIQAEKEKEQALQAIRQFAFSSYLQILDLKSQANEIAMNSELKLAGDNEEKQEEIREKYFEENKKVQMARATATTFEAMLNAYNAMVGIPIVGPILAPIASATAFAFGMKQVSNIKKQTYTGGSSGPQQTTQTDAFGSPTLDSADVIYGGEDSFKPEVINTSEQSGERSSSQRVYVLESDITSVQEDVKFVETVATL